MPSNYTWAITSGGIGQDNCTISSSITVTTSSSCDTGTLATAFGFDGYRVESGPILMECT